MSNHKNQHYVQRAYLEGFAVDDVPEKWEKTKAIWILNKETGIIRLKSIEKTAARNNYYSFVDKAGEKNTLIEEWFNPVEDKFPNLRQHIRDHISEINLTQMASNLDKKYRKLLAEYMYIHIVRVPKLFDDIKDESVKLYKKLEQEEKLPFDINRAQVMALRILIRVGNTPDKNIADELMKRSIDIEFFPRTKVSLATSDTPVVMYDETRSPGLAHETTSIFFPMDNSIFIRFAGKGEEIRMIKNRELKRASEFNHLIGYMAHKEVYCKNPESLLIIGKLLGIETKIIDPKI